MSTFGTQLQTSGRFLLAAGILLAGGCASDNSPRIKDDGATKKTAKGLKPITVESQLVGDTLAPIWFGIGATGPVFAHAYYPTNPIITIWSGELKAGETIRVGRRKPVVVEYSNGSNLYFSLGDQVAPATKARFGKDPIP